MNNFFNHHIINWRTKILPIKLSLSFKNGLRYCANFNRLIGRTPLDMEYFNYYYYHPKKKKKGLI